MSSSVAFTVADPFFGVNEAFFPLEALRNEIDSLFKDSLHPQSSLVQDPHAETRKLWNRVGKLLEKADQQQQTNQTQVPKAANGRNGSVQKALPSITPRSDVKETPGQIIIDIELPGVPQDVIKVDVSGSVLTISGDITENKSQDEAVFYHVRERGNGKFVRGFRLPGLQLVDPKDIAAEVANGILSVTIPKKVETPTSIPITIKPAAAPAPAADTPSAQ